MKGFENGMKKKEERRKTVLVREDTRRKCGQRVNLERDKK